MFMFLSQFPLSTKDRQSLRDFCIFVVLLYTKAWTRCSFALEAPKQDLDFIKNVIKFEEVDDQISSAVLRKIRGHLWYLSDETIALSLFDDNVTVAEKNQLRQAILEQPPPDESTIQHHLTMQAKQIHSLRLELA